MKTTIAMIFMCFSVSVFAQSDSLKTIYCELVGTSFLGKVTVEIDMGQSKGFFGLNTSYITDANGKAIRFNSMVDAMNFMGDKGWEFAQAYVVSTSSQLVYHWLLTQTVAKGKDGEYYPVTRKVFGN